jgi:hypothetical protein
MIGPVRGAAHLDLIRREAFYHVPVVAIAAARTSVTHIAFYEPASRFGGPGVIRLYAEVQSVRRAARRELPGLTWPGRGGEDARYYRFDLGPLLALPRPIANPARRRVVFRFVSLERLHTATSLEDLRVREAPRRPPRGKEAP